jgi:hypothetical protein
MLCIVALTASVGRSLRRMMAVHDVESDIVVFCLRSMEGNVVDSWLLKLYSLYLMKNYAANVCNLKYVLYNFGNQEVPISCVETVPKLPIFLQIISPAHPSQIPDQGMKQLSAPSFLFSSSNPTI